MTCTLCGNDVESLSHIAEEWLLARIREQNPEWVAEDGGCEPCIAYYRGLEDAVEVVPPE